MSNNKRKQRDYKNGIIYKIWSPSTGLQYIGSSTQPKAKRMAQHRLDKKNYELGKRKSWISSFLVLEHDDARIDIIEEYPCESKAQLDKIEGEYIRKLDCVNKKIPGRTPKEWRSDNSDIIRRNKKQHYEKNKEQILEKGNKYYVENKSKILQKKKQNYILNRAKILQQKKKYADKNKDKISEYQKEYYSNNKDRLNEYIRQYREDKKEKLKEKVKCEICGTKVNKYNLKRHKKSQSCLKVFE